MTGHLNTDGEPALPVRIVGPAGTLEIKAVVDTGFNGELTLPRSQIEALSLPEATVTEVTLADGRVRDVPVYDAETEFAGSTREIFVTEDPTTPLVGTGLLWGFSLYIEFEPDGTVEVDPLTSSS
jgi:clan AA aspartic protease